MGFGPGRSILGIKPLAEWRISSTYSWNEGGERLDNPSAPLDERLYMQYVDIQMVNLYISKRLAKGASFYCQIKNILNIKRLVNTDASYRNTLRLPWTDKKGNDEIGDYDKYYMNAGQHLMESPWWRFYPEKRGIYWGIRYQF